MFDPIPRRLVTLLDQALASIADPTERAALRAMTAILAPAVWQHWLAWRPAEDNRAEHEFIVLQSTLKIAEAERLSLAEKRMAIAVVFLHDTHFISRITEWYVGEGSADDRVERDRRRTAQREEHMRGGADNAAFLLGRLQDRASPPAPLFTPEEVKRVAGIIGQHDDWKLGRPNPAGSDRLAVVCLEGDALWPLHPLGVQADLERPNPDGVSQDTTDPDAWRRQLERNAETLCKYRNNWKGMAERFQDGKTIFRTDEGHRQYRAYCQMWNLE